MGNCASSPVPVAEYEMSSVDLETGPFIFKSEQSENAGRSRFFGLEVSWKQSPSRTWWIAGESTVNTSSSCFAHPNVPSEIIRETVETCTSFGRKLWAYRLINDEYLFLLLSNMYNGPDSEQLFKWSPEEKKWSHQQTHANGHFSWMKCLTRVGQDFYGSTTVKVGDYPLNVNPQGELLLLKISSDWTQTETLKIPAPHLKGKGIYEVLIAGQWGSTLLIHSRGCSRDARKTGYSFVDLETRTCTPLQYQGNSLLSISSQFCSLGAGRVLIRTGHTWESSSYFLVDIRARELRCLGTNMNWRSNICAFEDEQTSDLYIATLESFSMDVDSLYRFTPLV
jgi:hypothetical protein